MIIGSQEFPRRYFFKVEEVILVWWNMSGASRVIQFSLHIGIYLPHFKGSMATNNLPGKSQGLELLSPISLTLSSLSENHSSSVVGMSSQNNVINSSSKSTATWAPLLSESASFLEAALALPLGFSGFFGLSLAFSTFSLRHLLL